MPFEAYEAITYEEGLEVRVLRLDVCVCVLDRQSHPRNCTSAWAFHLPTH